ncbi:MAG: adenylate kinase [Elusimicrobiales bacterium]|nr:adenylate kinase [Elusimicrobiales bacterium]
MNLILLGAPGAGKGTQSALLCERLSLKHLSTGDILREEIGKKSPVGLQVAQLVSSGKLVPDALVLEIVAAKIQEEKDGLLFDGFPRTIEQAEGLDDLLEKQGKKIDAVVFIDLAEGEVIRRLTSRRTCKKCGKIYNLISTPPANPEACDVCGGQLFWRDDDSLETVKRRLMVYRDQTEPLVAYYKANHRFIKVDGALAPERVTGEICAALGDCVGK